VTESSEKESLTERQVGEEKFHDQWAKEIRIDEVLVRESFEAVSALENHFVLQKMGTLQGKRVLELGCGAGEGAVYFALQGAQVVATDISLGMLEVVKQVAKNHDVSVAINKMTAENIEFPDENFDFVYGNGVLHHVDFLKAVPEAARVLKPGGQAFFIEPLSYNPVINLYRYVARTVRTPEERPFRFRDFKSMKPYFREGTHKEFWFFTLLIFIYFFLIERVHPAKDRYWKKVIRDAPRFARTFRFLHSLDRFFLRIFPFLRFLCWNTVLVFKK